MHRKCACPLTVCLFLLLPSPICVFAAQGGGLCISGSGNVIIKYASVYGNYANNVSILDESSAPTSTPTPAPHPAFIAKTNT